MSILVDTSVWSMALRKKDKTSEEERIINFFTDIIRDLKLVIIGPIRQEILSGISDKRRFEDLKSKLSVFEDVPINTRDYELAAQLFNECRSKGIQGSHIDFLICAVSINNQFSIYTLDNDFENYQKYIPIMLVGPGR
uniref:PIN domain-containing protein n=1 Tax=Gracilinema caldarium TaxID=215591 RepID=A0A7C3E4C5_9SPIR